MDAVFVELPAFSRFRHAFFDDTAFSALQQLLLRNPTAGDVIPETGELRKIRFPDARRQKGTRGGLRVIYYWWSGHSQFWLFTAYGKDMQDDLTAEQKKLLRRMLEAEIRSRS